MRRLLVAVGLLMAAYGVVLLGRVNRGSWERWFLGGLIAHDLLLAPAVAVVGVAVARLVPAVARAPVQAGLLASGVLVVIEWPFLGRYGARPDDPSALPRDYWHGLLLVLAVVWLVVAAWTAVRARRLRTTPRPAPDPPADTPDAPAGTAAQIIPVSPCQPPVSEGRRKRGKWGWAG